jgi:hypothetical protein
VGYEGRAAHRPAIPPILTFRKPLVLRGLSGRTSSDGGSSHLFYPVSSIISSDMDVFRALFSATFNTEWSMPVCFVVCFALAVKKYQGCTTVLTKVHHVAICN